MITANGVFAVALLLHCELGLSVTKSLVMSECRISNDVLCCDGWIIRYPLLWNRPAESQDEIIRLMELLETMHGIPHQGTQIGLLQSSTHRHFNERTLVEPYIWAGDVEDGSLLPSVASADDSASSSAPIGDEQ